ncbi:P-loop containing nucleoside triphosphate hydrolase protein [Pseudoneurospora amorphoporcata]|uniref:Peroxisomal ATPase PEX1 n=1 Tax=Pseudoneurospora amorphoporcata TaxID=241081 RepID=A0AAN6SFA2_9PEZI|nr:P-loop containing nucleoside triphosphate hydrolase protein [Pseudoneurospora amorphoporcata]
MPGRANLRHGIDRDVYQLVLKLEIEEEDRREAIIEKEGKQNKTLSSRRGLSVSFVYDSIKRSNSSLARRNKKLLEDSIERVLDIRREEAKKDAVEDSDDAIEAAEAEEAAKRSKSAEAAATGFLNKQIAKAWGLAPPKLPAATAVGGDGAAVVENGGGEAGAAIEGGAGSVPQTPGVAAAAAAGASERQANGEPRGKKRKAEKISKEKEVDRSPPTGISIKDIAGVDDTLDKLLHEVWFPLCAGEACAKMGYRYDNGVLLHGPSGCGKTTLAHAVAGSVGAAFIPVSAPSIVGGTSGESEKNIRDVFDEAIRLAPCLVFIDEIDAIAGKRESANKGMEGRIVAEIMNGMDRIKQQTPLGKNVVVLAATNRPDFLDPAIRRRFSAEIDMGMPNERAREHILKSLSRDLNVDADVNFAELAKLTPGYVGSDLQYVVKAAVSESFRGSLDVLLEKARQLRAATAGAATAAITSESPEDHEEQQKQIQNELDDTLTGISQKQRDWLLLEDHRQASWSDSCITMAQFRLAVSRVQPASKREGFSTIPDTTWAHVGALDEVRKKLEMSIIGPIKRPELFTKVGIKPAAGILLWGPPGCGKTLVAKAVANESKANFISIKGPELLNKYVGESERAVRQLFARAKSSAPCILFFDEMDALVPKRDDSLSDASARVVNTLLTELDGVGDRSGIYVIGATNRPDIIDEAIRRPGRLGTSIYVGLPSAEDRVDILRTLYRNSIARANASQAATAPRSTTTTTTTPDAMEIDSGSSVLPGQQTPTSTAAAMDETMREAEKQLERVALDLRCTGFSGADLGNLMQAAAQACLERAYLSQMYQSDKKGVQIDEEDKVTDMVANPVITPEDWEKALNEVKPSVKDPEKYVHID